MEHCMEWDKANAEQARNAESFDRMAERYMSLYQENSAVGMGFRLRKQRVLELFDQSGGTVLDVGCGPGVFAEDLLGRGCTYWGIDHSAKMMEECRRRFGERPHAHFLAASGEHLAFPDQSFDAVLCVGVLDRTPALDPLLAELVRVLKQGGTLLLTYSNASNPYFLWRDFVVEPFVSLLRSVYDLVSDKPRLPTSPRHRLYFERMLVRTLVNHRCRVERTLYTGYNLCLPPLNRMLPRFATSTMEKLETLRDTRLRRIASMGILKARRYREWPPSEGS